LLNELNNVLKGKEVLVTGGCGFIGSEITKQLSSIGALVTVFDNLSSGREEYIEGLQNVKLIRGNLTDEALVKSILENKEYVIHLAALPFIPDSYYYPKDFFDVNVNGTINLASASGKKIRRFVYVSSSEVYGSARYTPMDENHPLIPQSTYSVSKLAAERVVYTIHKEHDLPAVIIRPFNSFGPNITQPYIIPEIASQLLKGNKEVKLGNINSKRDFTFVSDTARAIILSLVEEGIIGETINVGSERAVTIKGLVRLIAEILSKEVTIAIDPSRMRPSDVETLVCDYSKASRLLGWHPRVNIREGLELTLGWAMKNGVRLKTAFKGWPATYSRNFYDE
jgi:nucleoside-diphosphate-sugar epimerase